MAAVSLQCSGSYAQVRTHTPPDWSAAPLERSDPARRLGPLAPCPEEDSPKTVGTQVYRILLELTKPTYGR